MNGVSDTSHSAVYYNVLTPLHTPRYELKKVLSLLRRESWVVNNADIHDMRAAINASLVYPRL